MKTSPTLLAVAVAWPAAGAAAAVERSVESPLTADRLLQLGLGLTVVIALIGATAFVLKRFLRVPTGADGPVRILGGLSMGPRERVVLLEADGERLLVGVVPGRIQTLHVLGGDARRVDAAPAPDEGERFARVLSAAAAPRAG